MKSNIWAHFKKKKKSLKKNGENIHRISLDKSPYLEADM